MGKKLIRVNSSAVEDDNKVHFVLLDSKVKCS